MKHLLLLFFTASCLLASDATGTWEGTLKASDHDGPAYLVLIQKGDQVTGTAGPDSGEQHPISNGKASENGTITFEINDGSEAMEFSLKQTGNEIKGTLTRNHDGEKQIAKLEVRKKQT